MTFKNIGNGGGKLSHRAVVKNCKTELVTKSFAGEDLPEDRQYHNIEAEFHYSDGEYDRVQRVWFKTYNASNPERLFGKFLLAVGIEPKELNGKDEKHLDGRSCTIIIGAKKLWDKPEYKVYENKEGETKLSMGVVDFADNTLGEMAYTDTHRADMKAARLWYDSAHGNLSAFDEAASKKDDLPF